jgi:hypothetical protein
VLVIVLSPVANIKKLSKRGFEHGLSEAFTSFIPYAHKAAPTGF